MSDDPAGCISRLRTLVGLDSRRWQDVAGGWQDRLRTVAQLCSRLAHLGEPRALPVVRYVYRQWKPPGPPAVPQRQPSLREIRQRLNDWRYNRWDDDDGQAELREQHARLVAGARVAAALAMATLGDVSPLTDPDRWAAGGPSRGLGRLLERLAAHQRRGEAVAALRETVAATAGDQRAAAAAALARLGDSGPLAHLAARADHLSGWPEKTRRMLVACARLLPADRRAVLLPTALDCADADLAAAALRAMADLAASGELEPLRRTVRARPHIAAYPGAPGSSAGREAIKAVLDGLAFMDYAEAAGLLHSVLELDDPELYEGAVRTMVAMGDRGAVEALMAVLDDHRATGAAMETAARCLAACGEGDATAKLVAIVSDSGARDGARLAAARALAAAPAGVAVKPLLRALRSGDEDLRAAAAESLGEMGDPAAVRGLVRSLRDRRRSVRAAAAGALGKIGDRRAVGALVRALRDAEERVQLAAAVALGQIGDPRARGAVEAMLTPEWLRRFWGSTKPAEDALDRLRAAERAVRARRRRR